MQCLKAKKARIDLAAKELYYFTKLKQNYCLRYDLGWFGYQSIQIQNKELAITPQVKLMSNHFSNRQLYTIFLKPEFISGFWRDRYSNLTFIIKLYASGMI